MILYPEAREGFAVRFLIRSITFGVLMAAKPIRPGVAVPHTPYRLTMRPNREQNRGSNREAPCPPMSALTVILQATVIAPRVMVAAGAAGKATPPPAATAVSHPATPAGAAATARSAKEAARSKSEAKPDRLSGRAQSLLI